MPRPIIIDLDLATVDTNSVFEDQTTAGSGPLTLNGADVNSDGEWVSPDGFAHQISLESTGNLSGVTFAITGYSDFNKHNLITEGVTGPNNATVESTGYFAIITGVTVTGAVGTNVECGFVDEAVTQSIPLNWRGGVASVNIDVTGTLDLTIQNTFDDIQNLNDLDFNWQDSPSVDLINITSSTNEAYEGLPRALRVKVNSYSTGAEAQIVIQQRDV
jgi:hypothetical protein